MSLRRDRRSNGNDERIPGPLLEPRRRSSTARALPPSFSPRARPLRPSGVALRERSRRKPATIVVVFPDSGARYASDGLLGLPHIRLSDTL